jgi:DNA-binding transcriptional LysR family regulator
MDSRKIDLNLLVTLDVLLAELNETRAAKVLGLTQPTVSAHLARLREIFDDQLLVPSQRGMIPTAYARDLHKRLGDALAQIKGVMTHGSSFDPITEKIAVSISADDIVQHALLLPFALELRRQVPNVRLTLRRYDIPSLEHQMETGEIDIAVASPENAPLSLLSRRLYTQHFVIITRLKHPTIDGVITIEEFFDAEHVAVAPGRGNISEMPSIDVDEKWNTRNIVLTVPNCIAAAEIVARSDLIAVVPDYIATDRSERLQHVKLPFAVPELPLVMLWHQRNHGHAGHRWVRDALVRCANR